MQNLKIENINIKDLVEYKNNAKIHPSWQIEQIANSIEELGFNDPIAVNGDNVIIEGHGRFLACQKLGIKEIPCIRLTGMTKAQEQAYIIAHNKLTINTDFDIEALQREFIEIQNEGIDLELLGFEQSEIDELLNGEDEEEDTLEVDFDEGEEEGTDDKRVGFICPHCKHKDKKTEFLEVFIDE